MSDAQNTEPPVAELAAPDQVEAAAGHNATDHDTWAPVRIVWMDLRPWPLEHYLRYQD